MVESFDEQGLELFEEQEAVVDFVVVRYVEVRFCGGFIDRNGGYRFYKINEVSFIY